MGKSINPEIINEATASLINTLKEATPSFTVMAPRFIPVLRNAEGMLLWAGEEEYLSEMAAIRRAEEVRAAGFSEGNAA